MLARSTRCSARRYQGIDATAGMIMFSDGSVHHLNISWALPVTWPGAVYSLEVGIVGTDGVLTIDDTHRDIVLAVSKPQSEGYAPDKSRLVDFMGSYPPGDMALGELRGPMREETNSWLNRVALGVPTPAATAAEAHNRLMLTKALDLSAKLKKPVALPLEPGRGDAPPRDRPRQRRNDDEESLARLAFVTGRIAGLGAERTSPRSSGKTVRMVVGIGVGSGYDINARLLARHIGNAHSRQSRDHRAEPAGRRQPDHDQPLYAGGPFDGTVIGAPFNGMPTTPLLQPAGARFDPTKLNWLGSTNRETQVTYVWHTAPVQSLDDVRTKELDHRRAGAGLDPIRLSGARQQPVRLEVQGRHRLPEHVED